MRSFAVTTLANSGIGNTDPNTVVPMLIQYLAPAIARKSVAIEHMRPQILLGRPPVAEPLALRHQGRRDRKVSVGEGPSGRRKPKWRNPDSFYLL